MPAYTIMRLFQYEHHGRNGCFATVDKRLNSDVIGSASLTLKVLPLHSYKLIGHNESVVLEIRLAGLPDLSPLVFKWQSCEVATLDSRGQISIYEK